MRSRAVRRSVGTVALCVGLLGVAGCGGSSNPTAKSLQDQGWKSVSVTSNTNADVRTVVITGTPPYQGASLNEAALAAWNNGAGSRDIVEVHAGSTVKYFNAGDRKELMGDAAPSGGTTTTSTSKNGIFGWIAGAWQLVLVGAIAVMMFGLIRSFRARINTRRGGIQDLPPLPTTSYGTGFDSVGTRSASTGLILVPDETDAEDEPAHTDVTAQDVVDIVELLRMCSIQPVWIMGGWVADALAGTERAGHHLLEIAVGPENFDEAEARLGDVGFASLDSGPTSHGHTAVLADRSGRRVRITTLTQDPDRRTTFRLADGKRVDAAALTIGTIQDVTVDCIAGRVSPEPKGDGGGRSTGKFGLRRKAKKGKKEQPVAAAPVVEPTPDVTGQPAVEPAPESVVESAPEPAAGVTQPEPVAAPVVAPEPQVAAPEPVEVDSK